MSTLLEQASLVMIPSGYKEDIVYSQIPTNGNGDLSFTRASNGTRINSAGLVEVCPWNLADQSNTFGTSPWSNTLDTGATLTYTANYGTAPDGTTTAGRLQMALNGSNYVQKNQIISVITGQQYTYSVWIKSLSGNKNVIFCYDNTNNITASVTTEWQRFTHTFTGNSQVYARFVLEAGTSTSVDLLVYGAQLNIGSTAKPYFPTTDRLNVPRLTYQNGGGGCPSLLLEKQSTNLFTYSEQFDNGAWIKNNTTITANAITSPDGTQNADKIADSINTASAFYIYQSPATTSTQYTSSGYFKKGEYNFVTLHAFGLNGAVFNLNTGVLVSQSGGTGTITSVGNGWYRCTFTFTAGGSAVFFSQSPAGNISYTGTIGSGIYAWGLQCEASSYATTYIPTTSSSATRVADACYKTGISSLIGQTEGTLYFELQRDNTDNDTRLQISDGSGLNWLFVSIETGLNPRAYCNVGGVNQFSVYGSPVSNSTHKVALAYKSNDFKVYIDGVAVITQTSGSVPACNRIDVGSASPSGPVVSTSVIKEVVLFPTRLTNAELASLTTL